MAAVRPTVSSIRIRETREWMAHAIREWWGTLTDVREDERWPVVLMMLYGFLAMTSYYVVKPARNALFVERLGAENLPYVYIITAAVVGVVMVVYSRYVERIGHRALLLGTLAFLAANLLGFRWLLLRETFLVSGIFYVWGKLYPLLLVSQFWLVGNLLFSTRQAKRLFGPIGLGLIVGGIVGSSIAGSAADVLGTENLLLFAAVILGGCALLVLALEPHMRGTQGSSGRLVGDLSGDAVKLLFQSTHLRWIATILLVTILVTTLIDWQFNRAVEIYVLGEDAKTEFFGRFFLGLNVASILVQLLVTSFVLRRWGVGVALLALPAGLLAGTLGILVLPVLLTATLAKGAEGALRYSLDQSTRELLFLPVPRDVKYKVKPLIDLAVYRGGTGLGGLVLLLVTNGLGFGLRGVGVVAGLLTLGWMAATFRMRREFKDSVKRLIGIRDVGLAELIGERIAEQPFDEDVRRALEGGDEEEIIYSLGLVRHKDPRAFCRELGELLGHESPELRARALHLLTKIGDGHFVPEARALLVDPDLDVRIAAMDYVVRLGSSDPTEELRRALDDDEFGARAAAIAVVLRYGGTVRDGADPPTFELRGFTAGAGAKELASLCEEDALEARLYAAKLLVEADLDSERGQRVLRLLLDDPDASVRHAALRAAATAASGKFVPLVVERLGVPRDRNAAVAALSGVDDPGLDELLFDRLLDPGAPPSQRTSIPRILRKSAGQETVDRLFEALDLAPPQLRFEILKTLGKLRRDRDDLEFGERFDIEGLVASEVRDAYLWARRHHVVCETSPAGGFLAFILYQRMEEAAERAFRALGLHLPLEDLEASFVALGARDHTMRQQGFELVENALPRRYRELFDPLLNPDASWKERIDAAEARFDVPAESREEILLDLESEEGISASSLAHIARTGEPVSGCLTPEDLREEMASRVSLVLDTPHIEESIDIMDVLERADRIRRTLVFRELRGEELVGIAALMEERRYSKGEVLRGGAALELHVVLEGRLEGRVDGEGPRVVAGADEVFVDAAFLTGGAASSTPTAAEATRTLSLDRAAFFRLMEERFTVVRGILAHLGEVVGSPPATRSGAGGEAAIPAEPAVV